MQYLVSLLGGEGVAVDMVQDVANALDSGHG